MSKTKNINLELLNKKSLQIEIESLIDKYSKPIDMFDDTTTTIMKQMYNCLEQYERILISLKLLGFDNVQICKLIQFKGCSGTITYQINKIYEKIRKNIKIDFDDDEQTTFFDSLIYK